MIPDLRRYAVALSGFCAFLNLYSPQALLPELSAGWGMGCAECLVVIPTNLTAI